MNAVMPIARLTVLEFIRSRLFWLGLLTVALGFGAAAFLQQLAITEGQQVVAAILSATYRFCAVFLVAAFVTASLSREAADRISEFLLATALPRWAWLSGKLIGYLAPCCLLAAIFAAALLPFAALPAAAAWGLSLACELSLVAAASAAAALTIPASAAALFVVASFYVLARSIAAIQLMGAHLLTGDSTWNHRLVAAGIDGLAYLLPRLDLFAQAAWLTGAAAPDLPPVLCQTAIYLAFLAAVTGFDLYRKNF